MNAPTLADCVAALEARRLAVCEQMDSYGSPVAACDADFNALVLERAEITAALARAASHRAREARVSTRSTTHPGNTAGENAMRHTLILAAALAVSAAPPPTYQLAVMPRDSGKIYPGVAHYGLRRRRPDRHLDRGQGVPRHVGADRALVHHRLHHRIGRRLGWARLGYHGGVGGTYSADNPTAAR
jgi:hypothetical protein